MKLSGKVAFITGGTSGIGLATAKLFLREGARVAVTGRNTEKLDEVKKELGDNILVIKADVRSYAEMASAANQAARTFGPVNIFFANAGVAFPSMLVSASEDDYHTVMDTNVKGVVLSTKAMLPVLSDGASVILNTSFLSTVGVSGISFVSASKAAVRSFARSWSREFLDRKIRFNTVSPGYTDTPLVDKLGTPDEVREMKRQSASMVPVGRIGSAEDIAQAALFLASDASNYMVGSEIVVDGGISQI